MANQARTGFFPWNNQSGKYVNVTRWEVATAVAKGIFKGDLCTDVAGDGTVVRAAAGDLGISGVSNGASYVQNGKRISSKFLPISTAYTPTARGSVNASYVYLYDDPNCLFIGTFNAAPLTGAWADLELNYDHVDTAGNTTTGISGHVVDTSSGVTTTASVRYKQVYDSADNDVTITNSLGIFKFNEARDPLETATGA